MQTVSHLFCCQNIGTLNVSMDDTLLMQVYQSFQNLQDSIVVIPSQTGMKNVETCKYALNFYAPLPELLWHDCIHGATHLVTALQAQ